ncbi:hypothetical protein MHYP_G00358170, partial [Metynnis hypsauchen]
RGGAAVLRHLLEPLKCSDLLALERQNPTVRLDRSGDKSSDGTTWVTSKRERKSSSRSAPSATQSRTAASIKLAPTCGVCSDARRDRQRASPTQMPTRAKELFGARRL